ncbi:MAG: hypothetical protein JWO59_2555 [Chloroflexi bacterium]|nr:hypothetical protein [Chloroflexota bacterium]
MAGQIREWRRGPVRHALETLVRQRVLQIACGYEDQDDADTPRHDPLLKLVCGRLPTAADLASQPTFSRLENAVDARACYRLAAALVQVYLRERERDGVPTHLVLDLDDTDDPANGRQEAVGYHGYYRQHMYHPLLVFDGTTGQLITPVLRPGTCHASRGAVAVLDLASSHPGESLLYLPRSTQYCPARVRCISVWCAGERAKRILMALKFGQK